MGNRYAKSSQAGFSLVELILASGVLAGALGVMFGSMVSISIMGEVAEGRTRATTLLAGVMEEIRTLDYERMLTYSPNPITAEGMDIAVVLEAMNSNGESVQLPVVQATGQAPPNLPNPMEVRATIFWSMRGGRVYSVSSSTSYGR